MSTATMQMQTAPIDGLKIRYADSGTAHGPVVLLSAGIAARRQDMREHAGGLLAEVGPGLRWRRF